jgi:uncharacterized protein (DUF1501 family)
MQTTPSPSTTASGSTADSTASARPPVLVIVQLSGGNDFMNTLIPYTEGIYFDTRPTIGIPQDQVLPISDTLAFHPAAGPLRELYREGHVAIVQGIGYENSSRSHFRALDIWHTCEPEKVATEGWLAHVIRQLDPRGENPLTAVSFGRGLPRALAAPGVRATSVDNLDTYGLLSGIEAEAQRQQDLEVFKRMYTPAVGAGLVADYLRQTGQGVLDGAERLKVAVQRYQSDVQYADNAIARSLRDVARVHTAGLGTRVFYTQHGGYDHHAQELPSHNRLLGEVTTALTAFTQDLRAHDAADNVAILVFTEFGRRIKDNGSGTDHGSGGGAFVLGAGVRGGLYAEYPSLAQADWLNGEDLRHTVDFRSVYSTMLEQWMGIEARPIVGGAYEQLPLFQG